MKSLRIVPSDEFCRQAKRLAKKYKSLASDLTALQSALRENPYLGKHLGNGKYKIRLSTSSKGKGKRGGFRVITFHVVEVEDSLVIYLVTIYDKSEYESVSDKYVNQIIKGLK